MQTMTDEMTFEHDGWTFRYGGSRLADIYMGDQCIDCFQAAKYDWVRGEVAEQLTQEQFEQRCRDWVAEVGEDYRRNL